MTTEASKTLAIGQVDRASMTHAVPESYRVFQNRDGSRAVRAWTVRVPFYGMGVDVVASFYVNVKKNAVTTEKPEVSFPAAKNGIYLSESAKARINVEARRYSRETMGQAEIAAILKRVALAFKADATDKREKAKIESETDEDFDFGTVAIEASPASSVPAGTEPAETAETATEPATDENASESGL